MDDTAYTIPTLLAETLVHRGGEPALGVICAGELRWHTWREVAEDAARVAAMTRTAGIVPGDRVAQVSENRYEWIVTDLALHLAGAVHVPIHVTLSGEQMAEQIADCGARLVIVSNQELLAKFADRVSKEVLMWTHDERSIAATQRVAGDVAKPHAAPDDLATILYTSGTTGRPRGVMLSQQNLASNATAVAEATRSTGFSLSDSDGLKSVPRGGDADQTRLCILPLSHIYARTCDLYTWVYRGSRLVLAESRETLLRDCQTVRPNAISAVPYVYQRIAEGIRTSGAADESAALHAAFGGRMERPSCGGAPLPPGLDAWYAQHGLPVFCGYGLTEASPVVAMSTPRAHRLGRVGRVLPNVEVRLADDGEVLVRGPNVMLGYWQDEAATAEAIRDGWLYTGDLGEIDDEGYLSIHGRKKEMIVLSTGKKVAPTRVEDLLTASPLIEQAAVFGDDQSALVALIVPAVFGLAPDPAQTRQRFADEINGRLALAAREEQVRDFAVVDRPFSIERGELTPKLSLCRAVIAKSFASELSGLRKLSGPTAAQHVPSGGG